MIRRSTKLTIAMVIGGLIWLTLIVGLAGSIWSLLE
ncbi:hypothetical protein QFZ88_000445 [Mesorhizobium sp. YL-MeA3-2017]|nr:hypothetical protein [Mesorhizobium sp. YL-MeA3-2017]